MSAPGPLARATGWVCAGRWRQAGLLLAVCLAIFLPRLGATGFSMSEGHRVIPAWEMLDDAHAGRPHWLVPRMFGTAYLRKPPGVMWAIAASSSLLGENEFAARLPSALAATLLALAVWRFATRWFGSPWGLAAGLAQALLPVTWPSARSAEIESLHLLTTGVACLLMFDLLARPGQRFAQTWGRGLLLTIAMIGMLFTKGPAGAPFLGGVIFGAMLLVRRGERNAAPLTLLLALGIVGIIGALILRPVPLEEPVIRQGSRTFCGRRAGSPLC
ncbi:MAG: glycosyltransferase family 39 protein [Phycisphaerales bacterium]|nr:glycosyltransferase family 39 protein [Phycisphaerales bacterium]